MESIQCTYVDGNGNRCSAHYFLEYHHLEPYALGGSLVAMRWPGVEGDLAVEDLAEFRRLCQANSPGFILNHPDYCAFFTYLVFCGSVSTRPGHSVERPEPH